MRNYEIYFGYANNSCRFAEYFCPLAESTFSALKLFLPLQRQKGDFGQETIKFNNNKFEDNEKVYFNNGSPLVTVRSATSAR